MSVLKSVTSVPASRDAWRGEYVELLSDGSWSYWRCCRCDGPLTDDASRARGLGPNCAKASGADSLVRKARAADRLRWAAERRARFAPPRTNGQPARKPGTKQLEQIAALCDELGRQPTHVTSAREAWAEIQRLTQLRDTRRRMQAKK